MPAFYAHKRFGEEVISAMPPAFSEILQKYPTAFYLGTQGPDILFYHQPIRKNPIKQKGVDTHHTSADGFFIKQAKRLLDGDYVENKDGACLPNSAYSAYIMGFICHFTLDVHVHPHVYEKQATGVSHGKIESEFDKYLLRKDGKPIRGYNTAGMINAENGTAEACAKTMDVTLDQAKLAIKTIRFINSLFSNKCEVFHHFAHFVLKIAGMDNKFGDMFLHKKDDPACADWNDILYQDYLSALPKAKALIEEYFSTLSNVGVNGEINEFFRNNYTGGTL